MDEHASPAVPPPQPKSDLRWLALLLLLAAALRVWQITHTEVLARDSIGFIRLAWQLEHEPWTDLLHRAEQHPGYPLLISLTSLPLRYLVHLSTPVALQFSAQLVSAVASVLLIIPMFLLGRALFSGRVAFWSCLLFQFLPTSARLLADGLSEATFLLFAVTALYLAHRAFRSRSPVWFVFSGVSGGLAYLTRPEGALTVAATGIVLLALQALPGWRRPWRNVLLGGGGLAAGAALIAVPLLLLSGRVILKPAAAKVLETSEYNAPLVPEPPPEPDEPRSQLAGGPPWAVWWQDETEVASKGWWWGLRAVGHETVKGFQHVLWLPALLGLIVFGRRTFAHPAAWVMLLVCGSIFGLLWRLASVMGYVSDRHTVLIVLCGGFWAVAAIEALAHGIAKLCRWSPQRIGPISTTVLLAALVGVELREALEPLHGDRAGFRTVGLWLAEHADPEGPILDPYCWTAFYAGVDFRPPPRQARTRYVVLEKANNPHGHLPLHRRAQQLSQRGTLVYTWSGRRGKSPAEIQVYEMPLR